MDYKRKRLCSFIIVGIYLFLGGAEYAVIFPTAWEYLQSLGADKEHTYWLGFTVSGYSFTAAISGIVGGRIADIYPNQTKNIAYVSILIMAIGNIQYLIGINVWNILASRLVCGFGTAAGAAMLAEVCRCTKFEERTPILAMCNACRQLGILIGPAFQIILSFCNFSLFGLITVTPLNAPGLFMACCWTCFSIMILFMFNNLSEETKKLRKHATTPLVSGQIIHSHSNEAHTALLRDSFEAARDIQNYGTISTIPDPPSINGDLNSIQPNVSQISENRQRRKSSVTERFIHSFQKSSQKQYNTSEMSLMNASMTILSHGKGRYLDEFLQDTFVVLLSMVFSLFFCQVGVETMIPIVMGEFFGFGIFENSLVYMAGGLLALILFFTVACVSRYVRDTSLNMVGWSLMFSAQVWLMMVMPYFEEGNRTHMIFFLIGVLVMYLGYPISSVANTGLFSKALSDETQGLGQGIRRMISYLGLIFGPLWAGSNINRPYLLLGVPCSIMLFNATMFLSSFKRLRDMETQLRSKANSEASSLRASEENSRERGKP